MQVSIVSWIDNFILKSYPVLNTLLIMPKEFEIEDIF